MTTYVTTTAELTSVADAIRSKGGTSATLTYPAGFNQAIADIQTGTPLLTNTATFVSDSTNYAIHSVASSQAIQAPVTPTKSGYVFKGWGDTASSTTYYSFPWTPTATSKTFNAVWQQASIGSITGLGSSSPSDVSFSVQSGLFDDIEEVTVDGNVFIKFPKMYRKVVATASSQIASINIANAQVDSDYQIYPCFLEEDGTTEMDYILMGKYCSTSNTVATSVNGSAVSMTPSVARTACRNVGTGYQQMDWMIFRLWQDLLIAKMETVNTNSGTGIGVDALGVSWENNSSKTYPWIDGIVWNGSSNVWYMSYKPTKFVDSATASTDGYTQADYSVSTNTSGGCISKLGYDASNPFFNYPSANTSDTSSYSTYYCDAFYFGTGSSHSVYSYVGYAFVFSGAFSCNARNSWTSTNHARLCYRPVTQ